MRLIASAVMLLALAAAAPGYSQNGSVTLDHVDGLNGRGQIRAGTPVTFFFRYHNTTGNRISGVANGFEIYSPDGALWLPPEGAHVYDWSALFGSVTYILYHSADGMDVDTVFFAGADVIGTHGLTAGFNEVMCSISTEVEEVSYEGRHLCLDSTSRELSAWEWRSGAASYFPAWDGPHCFEIIGPDSDGDGVGDYSETQLYGIDPYDPDTDNDGLSDLIEIAPGSSQPHDCDTDDDGLGDGEEDADLDGVVDPGETSPVIGDSDSDGLMDGLESGRVIGWAGGVSDVSAVPYFGTDVAVFTPDTDPASTTDPRIPDTDGDALTDGDEDSNSNGAVDPTETDPNDDDTDDDTVLDGVDNCALVPNAGQEDQDGDGIGNACEEPCLADGDVNGSGGTDTGDLVDFINYLYIEPSSPLARPWAGDLTGDCLLDTLDIARLVCVLFQGCPTDPMPTCCNPGTRFAGDGAAPIGGSIITEDEDGITVGDIGESGDDGVRIYPIEEGYSGGFRSDLENVILDGHGDGIHFKFRAYIEEGGKFGALPGIVLREVGMAGVTNVNGQIQITADFNPIGDPEVEFRAWVLGGSLMSGLATVQGGGVIAQGTAVTGSASVTSVSILANTPPAFSIKFDRLVMFTLNTNPVVQVAGDEIHLVAVNATGSIAGLGPADVTGEYIGWFGMSAMKSDVCCLGFVGNVNMDPTDGVTIGDISMMIDNLFISGVPLPCLEEADVNLTGTLTDPPLGPEDITIGDISMLIDHLFISQGPTVHCP